MKFDSNNYCSIKEVQNPMSTSNYIKMLESTIIALADHFECEPEDLIEEVLGEDVQTPERDAEMSKKISSARRLSSRAQHARSVNGHFYSKKTYGKGGRVLPLKKSKSV